MPYLHSSSRTLGRRITGQGSRFVRFPALCGLLLSFSCSDTGAESAENNDSGTGSGGVVGNSGGIAGSGDGGSSNPGSGGSGDTGSGDKASGGDAPTGSGGESPASGGAGGESDTMSGGNGSGGDQAILGLTVQELLEAYEAGEITYEQLAASAPTAEADPPPEPLGPAIEAFVYLPAGDYTIGETLTISEGATLVLGAGAHLALAEGVSLEVLGKIYALGTEESRTTIEGPSATEAFDQIHITGLRSELHYINIRYGNILLMVEDTEDELILVDHAILDSWVVIDEPRAVLFEEADGLVVQNSDIGMNTPQSEMKGQTGEGINSGGLFLNNRMGARIDYEDVFDFGPCDDGHHPVLVGNVFMGGEDDGIDFDECSGIVAYNYVKKFTGGPVSESNGGCFTGTDTRSLYIGNVLEDCVHAFGYKGDARPVLLNNTIVDCDEGFRILDNVEVKAIGNLFYNNGTDLVGTDAEAEDYFSGSQNLFDIPVLAEGNLSGDPLFETVSELPYGLSDTSPALNQVTYEDIEALLVDSPFTVADVEKYLSVDFLGTARDLSQMDIGAVERQ